MANPPLSYGNVHPSFSKGCRWMATKPIHSGASMITMSNKAFVAKCLLLIKDLHSGETFGQQNRSVNVLCWWTGRAQKWQWGFDTWDGDPVSDTECQSSSRTRHCPHCVDREEAFHPTDLISHPQQPQFTSLPQLALIFPTVLGESAPTYANIRLSFINIYAGKHICSSVCTAGALLLRQSVVSSGESTNLC